MVSYLHSFPFFAPADEKGFIYRGFIQIYGTEHYLEIHLANPATGTAASIYGSQELHTLLSPQQSRIQTRLDQCQDIGIFLSDLKNILEQVCTVETIQERIHPSFERYNLLIAELNTIGYEHLESMNDTMDELVFKYRDALDRQHWIKAIIPPLYPLQSPIITVDIPTTENNTNTKTSNNNGTVITSTTSTTSSSSTTTGPPLSHMLATAVDSLNRYQPFFDNMDQLDKQARVLDPSPPSRSDHWRRIALGNHCSLQLTVYDPTRPTLQPPMLRFFGNEKNITPFQQAWQQFLDTNQWRSDLSLLDNLVCPLPSIVRATARSTTSTTGGGGGGSGSQDIKGNDDDMACAICYAYKLDLTMGGTKNQETPDTICSNQHCNRGFHPSCLYEWLRSNPSTTKSFNILFGHCPYCNDKITIKAIL